MNLSIRNVTKEFATPEGVNVCALDNVSLEVAANEFLVPLFSLRPSISKKDPL